MALEPGSGRRSVSPEGSSGRDSPLPRQWRNQLGGDEVSVKDKNYRKYAAGVDRALALFETALKEWADYISFLNRLMKALQARQSSINTIPSKATVAKRLSQCLNPSLPSGVHQKALEVYNHVFAIIGTDDLSRDLPLYLPGLAPTLSFASLSTRSPFLGLLERHFLTLEPRSLRPAMKSLILALLPGLEEETSEDFDRTLRLLEKFKAAIRPPDSERLTEDHSTGDDYFWQCFFLASITSQSRRPGALAYLVRSLPRLDSEGNGVDGNVAAGLAAVVTSPEPGLLLRCFAAGLADEQLLIQRGFLDLLVTHLPLHSRVLRSQVKPQDLELLLRAAVGVVTRRDMSLNRRLWAWLLGPDPAQNEADAAESPSSSSEQQQHALFAAKTNYFEEHGLQPLTGALLAMIEPGPDAAPAERARPYRICLSLMDRWEIGGLVVSEVFLPIVDSVRKYKSLVPSKAEFNEVLRSASVFFDGVESGLIYGEIVGLLAGALGPGSLADGQRLDKLALVSFILANFNVREEEMVTVHAPLVALAVLCMLEDGREGRSGAAGSDASFVSRLAQESLNIAASLLEPTPERAFPGECSSSARRRIEPDALVSLSNVEVVKRIRAFYVNDQGNLDSSACPFTQVETGELLLRKASGLLCDEQGPAGPHVPVDPDPGMKIRLLSLLLSKLSSGYGLDGKRLLLFLHENLEPGGTLSFRSFSSILGLATHLYSAGRASFSDLSDLVVPLVRRAWGFLSASEPKFHVETVRCLWRLQSALSPANREVEAAIAGLMIAEHSEGIFAHRPADPGRTFGVLWTHSLQDGTSHSDRRGSKLVMAADAAKPRQRIAGADFYQTMLTRPLFIMLDSLLDERTQLFMTTKAWLNSLVGAEQLFHVFVSRLCDLPFLAAVGGPDGQQESQNSIVFTPDDDIDLCIYYLRTLSNVLRWAPDAFWDVLARKTIESDQPSGEPEDEVAFQDFFLRVCFRCVMGKNPHPDEQQLRVQSTQLHRCALTVLHQLLLNPASKSLFELELVNLTIERLFRSLEGPDPYVQVLLLDVVFSMLRLREQVPLETPTAATEKRTGPVEPPRAVRLSVSNESRPKMAPPPPPPSLLKCVRAGLGSVSSRPVLDSWVSFLTECLPLYSDSVFQILIPLVETLCKQINRTVHDLKSTFHSTEVFSGDVAGAPESTLISLINALERVLARAHDQLLEEETRSQALKSPDQPQSFFGNMVSGVFNSDTHQSRSATANDRLTVNLAFQDAVRICFGIWTWGQGDEVNRHDPTSAASFNYTSLRMRNRARRLLEHLFAAETLECLETIIDLWRPAPGSEESPAAAPSTEVFNLLSALDGSRPKHTMPAIFNAIYSRTNPAALLPSRKSTLTISLADTDLVIFLVDYARSLDDDAMDEIWQDCIAFLKDLLGNPFPHRRILASLLEFAAILGEKVDNTNFGEQRKMRRELGDVFLRLLTALFTTKPISFAEPVSGSGHEKAKGDVGRRATSIAPLERAEDAVSILASVIPSLHKILLEPDRILSAAATISSNVVGPTLRSRTFPDTVSKCTVQLLSEMSKLPNNQKIWKKDVGDAFNDHRFFGMRLGLVEEDWLPLLRYWTASDKDRMPEIVGRISPPSTAGIVFGVGASVARQEADRRTQLNLRRIATLVLACGDDTFVTDLAAIFDKAVELLAATSTSSPSSTTRADVFMVIRALVLRTSPIHLAMLWPVVNAELHAAMASVVSADHSRPADTYNSASVLQACKLLDLLVCVAPDDFQLHEWLFVADTVDAVHHRSSNHQSVALVDELSEELGSAAMGAATVGSQAESTAYPAANNTHRKPLLGLGGISDEVGLERKDELVARVLRPFFGQLSIYSFESTYAMGPVDRGYCVRSVLRDLFDEKTLVKTVYV